MLIIQKALSKELIDELVSMSKDIKRRSERSEGEHLGRRSRLLSC